MLVFDGDGVGHEKEPVDAAECIGRLGWALAAKATSTEADVPEDPLAEAEKAKKK